MICIFSRNNDYSTSEVIRWLNFYKEEVVRINREDVLSLSSFSISDVEETNIVLTWKEKKIAIPDIYAFWYRRGLPNFKELSCPTISKTKTIFKEVNTVSNALHNTLNKKPSIGNSLIASVNKLDTLQMASKAGLSIPATMITSQKEEMLQFLKKYNHIITKPIYEAPFVLKTNEVPSHAFYTSEVDVAFIEQLPQTFFMSLFQERLKKKYELRVFYLHGDCYAMAIFSQKDKQTATDFRQYNKKKPNRTTPYKLSEKMIEKIQVFMNMAQQDCGSLDLVVTTGRKIVFLEVNPVGQFGMISKPCNYGLEKKIAQYLSRKNHKNENRERDKTTIS
jgi:ATP-GRASP peptide maturase of grasp-with-spasm system